MGRDVHHPRRQEAAPAGLGRGRTPRRGPKSRTETEGKIAVPGGSVWYRIAGADSPGVPLLVLHGGPGAGHDYLEPLQALADERPVIFYDQLGCGRSDIPDDASLLRVDRFVGGGAAVRGPRG